VVVKPGIDELKCVRVRRDKLSNLLLGQVQPISVTMQWHTLSTSVSGVVGSLGTYLGWLGVLTS